MRRVYIVGGLRSHFGVRYGIFKHVRPEVLGAEVLKELKKRYFPRSRPDVFLCGNAVGPGGNIGRLTWLEAGLAKQVPALTLDLQCASGLAAIDMAAAKIRCGGCDLVVAGGTESASLAPRRIYPEQDERSQKRNPEFTAAQFIPKEFGDDAMLLGAERAAKKADISRQEADEAALLSHQKAMVARGKGYLDDVILPLFGSTKDEAIRPRMGKRLLARAPRVTKVKEGILTSANACTMNDGAAFVVLASESWVEQHHAAPWAEVLGTQMIGGDPKRPPLAADLAVETLLDKWGMIYRQIDAFEYNEAFAVISAHFYKTHPEVADRFNSWGGALAYGHPYGASGAEIMIHLIKRLQIENGRYGVAAIPAAGGIGEAVLVKTVTANKTPLEDLGNNG